MLPRIAPTVMSLGVVVWWWFLTNNNPNKIVLGCGNFHLRIHNNRFEILSEDNFLVTASQQPGPVCVLLSQASNPRKMLRWK
jgi:hypothetical protein